MTQTIPIRPVVAVTALLVFAGTLAAQGGRFQDLNFQPVQTTGEFNAVAFGLVLVAVAVIAAVVWLLQLFLAKILVWVIPALAGVAAAVTIPIGAESKPAMAIGLNWVILGVAFSLVCQLYASIYDLKRKAAGD